MQATFYNRFETTTNYEGTQRIRYVHNQSKDISVYIQRALPQTDTSMPALEKDWEIVIEGPQNAVTKDHKEKIAGDLLTYIKRRTKKSAHELCFKELGNLAVTRSIK